MRPRIKAITTAGGVLAGAMTAAAIGSWRWDRATREAMERLDGSASTPRPRPFTRELLEGLPQPVIRYFEQVMSVGQPLPTRARVEQAGVFRTGGQAPWAPIRAVQHYTIDPPGFVWDARIRIAPLVAVRVRDSYFNGSASVDAQLCSLARLAHDQGRPELDCGALHRYLAEAVWFPSALLPGHGVTWIPVDSHCAQAHLTDGGSSVSLEFRFGASGEIVGAFTTGRQRAVKGGYLPTPWECSYRDYRQMDGMRVPVRAGVEWLLPEARLCYFRGRATTIRYGYD